MPEENKAPHITCEHLLELEGSNEPEHVVIDLRDPLEYDSGHIKGSHNVPRRELKNNLHNVVPEKGARVIVVVGPTHEEEIDSIHETLAELGYKRIEFLAGGFDRYCEIADLELDEADSEMTPEEMGFVGHGEGEDDSSDPHASENEPLF